MVTMVMTMMMMMVEWDEAGGDFTQLQRSVEDPCEDGGQLVSTDFQTGG